MENKKDQNNFSFRKEAWRQFKKNRAAYFAFYIILFLLFTALLAPFIANHHPLYTNYKGTTLFPAFSTILNESKIDTIRFETENGEKYKVINYNEIDWRTLELNSVVWAPIPYSPYFSDKYNRDYISPFAEQRYKNSQQEIINLPTRLRHFLGTDKLGRDLAAGIVHGSKISLLVGIFAMLIASMIGIPLGAIAGYFGNEEITIPRLQFWLGLLGLFLGLFIAFIARSYELSSAFENGITNGFLQLLFNLLIAALIFVLFFIVGKKLAFGKFWNKKVYLPIDAFISRAIEVLNSLPALILIITIAAIINERSMFMLVIIIGFTSWTGIARFMRAEMLKIKEMEYIQTAKALGYSNSRIIFKHAMPNGLAPVFTTIAFGIASAILIESGLSFLGIGVPDDVVTWGNLLNLGREEFEASWLVVFPGLAIFITVTAYNLIGEGLRNALDPKMKK